MTFDLSRIVALLGVDEDLAAADEVLIFGKRLAPLTAMDTDLFGDPSELTARTHPVMGPLLRKRDRLYPYIEELMGMTLRTRRRAVCNVPYRNLSLADALLAESRAAAERSLERSEELALAAEWIAALPWPEASEQAAWIRAGACLLQGDARCKSGDWHAAELRYGAAFSVLKKLPPFVDHVFFYVKLSKLREAQGRLYEAVALQLWAIHLERWISLSGRVRPESVIRLAYLALKRNDLGCAMTLLTQLWVERQGGWLAHTAKIALGRAACLAALGLAEPARRLVEESVPQRRAILNYDSRLHLEWFECKIAVQLEDLEQAIPRLEAIRRWLLRGEHGLAEICLCSIDLALAYAKSGQVEQRLPALLLDIAQFPEAAEHPWALGSLWWFRAALGEGRPPAVAAREAAEIVHRRERSLARFPRP